jgi:chromosome segregation ATPase
MKKLMTIFGAFFLASVVLTSCGDVNVKDLDKGIDNEEDAVEAMITITKAKIEMINKAMGPMQELADMEDRADDISDAKDDLKEKIRDEKWDEDDFEDADNWDEFEELEDEYEDLSEDFMKLREKAF